MLFILINMVNNIFKSQGKDSANRRQNKINVFIFSVEMPPILSKVVQIEDRTK